MSARTTISLIDDDERIIDLWTRRILRSLDFTCVGAYATAEAALPVLVAEPPQVALVDLKLPGRDGLCLCCEFKDAHPHSCAVLITGHDEDELPRLALLAGVDGCLLKHEYMADPLPALRRVLAGECVFSAHLLRRLGTQLRAEVERTPLREAVHSQLSLREGEVLERICRGFTAKEIADQMRISVHTVDIHCREIRRKLAARNTPNAVHKWHLLQQPPLV